MIKEIRSTLDGDRHIHSVWGFGSFFRHEPFDDIDVLVVVVNDSGQALLMASKAIRAKLVATGLRIGVQFDALILTSAEFDGRPLRDMHELIRII